MRTLYCSTPDNELAVTHDPEQNGRMKLQMCAISFGDLDTKRIHLLFAFSMIILAADLVFGAVFS